MKCNPLRSHQILRLNFLFSHNVRLQTHVRIALAKVKNPAPPNISSQLLFPNAKCFRCSFACSHTFITQKSHCFVCLLLFAFQSDASRIRRFSCSFFSLSLLDRSKCLFVVCICWSWSVSSNVSANVQHTWVSIARESAKERSSQCNRYQLDVWCAFCIWATLTFKTSLVLCTSTHTLAHIYWIFGICIHHGT